MNSLLTHTATALTFAILGYGYAVLVKAANASWLLDRMQRKIDQLERQLARLRRSDDTDA